MDLRLLFVLCCAPIVYTFHLEVSPKKAVFRIGDREVLRCTVKNCDQTPELAWIALADRPMDAQIKINGSEALVSYNPVKSHHENQLRCEASCGGERKQTQVIVKVFSFPDSPEVTGHERLVLGEESALTCIIRDVYPGEYTELEWRENDQILEVESGTPDARILESKYLLKPTYEDEGRNITCAAKHHLRGIPTGLSSIQATVRLSIRYAPRAVQVTGQREVEVGTNVKLHCDAQGNPRPQIQWRVPPQLQVDGRLVMESADLTLYNVSHIDAGLYECLASNDLATTTARLNVIVYGPPRNTSLTLSPAYEVSEGESVTLSCRTFSVPVGGVRLFWISGSEQRELEQSMGSEVNYTLPSVQLSQAGLYLCEAFNQYGTHSNSTQLRVKAPPRNSTIEVFPSCEVMEGENVTICCHAVSYPPPTITLCKVGNDTEIISSNGTFLLTNLLPTDAGQYRVNVTNELGHHTQVFSIRVTEKSRSPLHAWEDLLIPAVVMGTALACAALVLDYVYRARRKGSYELAKCDPSSA